jgi:hypothetical protein
VRNAPGAARENEAFNPFTYECVLNVTAQQISHKGDRDDNDDHRQNNPEGGSCRRVRANEKL